MAAALSEYELEGLHELEAGHESQQFFGALANLARRGVGWVAAPGSPQRQLALSAARQVLRRGLPALGRWAGGQIGGPSNGSTSASLGSTAASWLSGLLPQQEFEGELEWESHAELNPIRKVYSDAMMEHLGHAAAETHSEAEAEGMTGAMIPLAARVVPGAAAGITRATPGLVCGLTGIVQTLRRSPATRPLMRTVPTIVRRTAANIAQQAARGVVVTPQAAVRALAQQTLRVLGTPRQAVHAFKQSRALDKQFHRASRPATRTCTACHKCGARLG